VRPKICEIGSNDLTSEGSPPDMSDTPDTAREAERVRTVRWDDPMIGATAAVSMSGLDYLRAIASGEIPPPPIAVLLGFGLERVDTGRATFTVESGEHLYNPIGSVHGGVLATLLDSALGCAVHSTLPAGVGYTTVDLNVTYLRPATKDTGRLTCESEIVHSGRKIGTARAQIVDDDGRLYATGTTTCVILTPRPSPKDEAKQQ
jgi:uncharacterized protein (TIGR00369 family)